MKRRVLSVLLVFALLQGLTPGVWAVGTPAGTSISNQAYVDYKDANGNAMPRVFSNTVTTVVSQVGGITVSPATEAKNGIAGTDVYYDGTVCNTGNGPDTMNLAVVNSQPGWTTKIYLDTNGNGIWDAGETTEVTNTGVLAADACFKVIVVTSVPAGAANNTVSNITLTGTSTFDNTKTATATYTTTVQAATLSITKVVTPVDPKPGDVITYAVTGINNGSTAALNIVATDVLNANVTYVAGSMRSGPVGGTYATAAVMTDANDVEPNVPAGYKAYYNAALTRVELNWPTCPPNGVFYYQVRVNPNVPAGTSIQNTLAATYQLVSGGTTYNATSNQATVSVANLPAVLLDPDRTGTANPGDTKVYAFTVYNNGNDTDTINLTYASTAGWTWTFWKDVDNNGIPGTGGDTLLTDTNGDGKIDTGVLAALGSVHVLAVATIPAGSADRLTDITTVTGTSVRSSSVSDPETLTTTITAPVLSVTKAVSPTGNQPPGTVLTYAVTVTNNGTGNATNVIITDVVPQYTTYQTGTIRTGATTATLVARTDASDGDGGRYDSGSKTILVGSGSPISLGASGTWILEFKVKID